MPATIFISVDLPAPFSPIRRWTSPGSTLRFAVSERDNAAKALLYRLKLKKHWKGAKSVYTAFL